MRGTVLVSIGTERLYAYVALDGRAVRLRVSLDECDRLDLLPGRQVRVGLPDQEPRRVLISAVSPAPPFAWVEVEFAAAVCRAG
ncbi:hypothetical protein [Limnoglobus roseus]|uniref:Uncharacterized protein n=1 Tax=Limnoglobus roseus TaxID=2598579 RepID=A0A5C1ARM1_9BACT|nr:hypothetical protein [Limnoglobus roseus]QEL20666.1 hypothetical protein PX52LOC_07773 [Limnoglobus roseus]